MKLRQEWMTDKDYFGENYPNNRLLQDAIHRFEVQKQSMEGRDALIDGVQERVVVQNHTNPLNQAKYDKKISFDMDSKVHSGSVLEFDDKIWLLISKIFDKYAYKVGSVKECNASIFIQTGETEIFIGTDPMGRDVYEKHPTYTTYHCVVDSKIQNPYDNLNAAINLPEGQIAVMMPYNEIVKDDTNFELWGYQFKVIGVSLQYVVNNEGPMVLTAQRVTGDAK